MESLLKKAASCAVAAAALSASVAAHADLVTNGGFETGDFTGWTLSGDTSFTGVDTFAPHDGAYAAFSGSLGGVTISQTLATQAGMHYVLQFWLQIEADPNGNSIPNFFSASWGGTPVAPAIVDSPAFGYTEFQYVLDASSASTDLAFSFSNTPAFTDFDSVSVNVPEPTSLALALGALGILAVVKRHPSKKPETVRLAS